jgi:hypothetical protein
MIQNIYKNWVFKYGWNSRSYFRLKLALILNCLFIFVMILALSGFYGLNKKSGLIFLIPVLIFNSYMVFFKKDNT